MPKYPSTDLAYSLAPERPRRRPGAERPVRVVAGHAGQRRRRRQPDRRAEGELHRRPVRARDGRRASSRRAPRTTHRSRARTATARGRIPSPPGTHAPTRATRRPTATRSIQQIRRGLTEFRGAYYQDEGWQQQVDARKVAVFSIQGWTDDLFEAVESFRMFKYLKRLDPRWPVEVALADVGHSRAQNKPETWQRLNDQAFQWLQSNINAKPRAADDGVERGDRVRRPRRTAARRRPHARGPGERRAHAPVRPRRHAGQRGGGRSQRRSPPTRSRARSSSRASRAVTPTARRSAATRQYSQPLASTKTYVGLGFVRIPYVWTAA